MNYIEAVIGIFIKNNKVYITKGKDTRYKWEFPGGKIKKHENIINALKRELQEEVGIIILQFNFFQYIKYTASKKKLKLYFFLITQWKGKLYSREKYFYIWKYLCELKSSDFPPANFNVINSLKRF